MKFGIIYKATNILNNKSYIGQTQKTLEHRKAQHLRHALNSKRPGYNTHFYNAIRKYGPETFEFSILQENIPTDELNDLEMFLIEQLGTFKNGYNSTLGGESTKGLKCSEETKKKISNTNTGRKFTKEHRENLRKPKSEEHKKNMRKPKSEEAKERMRKPKSPQHIQKIVETKTCTYQIIYPNGTIQIIRNLRKFCRDNSLDQAAMWRTSKSKQKNHKGFKCLKIED